MDLLITIIRWLISFAVLSFILNHYVKYFYGFSLTNYLAWVFSPKEDKSPSYKAIPFVLIIFIVSLFFFSLFLNKVFIKLYAEQRDYIYLGNSGAFIAQYYQQDDHLNKLHIVTSPEIQYNNTFDNIGRIQTFLYDSTLTQDLGMTVSQFSIENLIVLLLITSTFMLILLGPLHAVLKPMGGEFYKGDGHNFFHYQWNHSFDALLKRRKASLAMWFILCVLSLFVALFTGGPRQQFTDRAADLPLSIRDGQVLTAFPVEMEVIYETITVKGNDNKDTTKVIKTSRRYVTFKFNDIFDKSVFVTAIYDIKTAPVLEKLIIKNINAERKMNVVVNHDLGIDILQDEN